MDLWHFLLMRSVMINDLCAQRLASKKWHDRLAVAGLGRNDSRCCPEKQHESVVQARYHDDQALLWLQPTQQRDDWLATTPPSTQR